mmetsp:Transcript_33432/g.83460  ORF Transcript_33432/g.83460 Transcript_33432/m.83460 type:complete len:212 (-) Transcript_33432:95-730(-)
MLLRDVASCASRRQTRSELRRRGRGVRRRGVRAIPRVLLADLEEDGPGGRAAVRVHQPRLEVLVLAHRVDAIVERAVDELVLLLRKGELGDQDHDDEGEVAQRPAARRGLRAEYDRRTSQARIEGEGGVNGWGRKRARACKRFAGTPAPRAGRTGARRAAWPGSSPWCEALPPHLKVLGAPGWPSRFSPCRFERKPGGVTQRHAQPLHCST